MSETHSSTTKSFARRRVTTAALAVVALVSVSDAEAFVRPSLVLTTGKSNPSSSSSSSTELGIMNFLNDGKKALVKSLAGEYDAAAVKARISGLIDDNSVLMFR